MKTPSQNLEDSMNQLTQSEPSAPSWVLPELEGSMAFDGLQEGPAMVNGVTVLGRFAAISGTFSPNDVC
ncbi:hypothetical protein EYZ11_001066 [Aspergillus tanneri]|uniref:Uncharacterized protein n=1 Tax=Aspergillus tanneri TaxID=1220188 RepID=A0A4S3JVG4_9EURO|nr:hypothetical protein EYZ11_001066 [Aspergillus tanneri]